MKSCPALCDLMDCSLSGSSVHEISQARILEWVAFPSPGHLYGLGIESTSTPIKIIKKNSGRDFLALYKVMVKEENQTKEDGLSLGKWELWGNSTILTTNWQPDTDGSKYIRKNEDFRDGLSLHVFYPSCVVCYIPSPLISLFSSSASVL